MRRWSTLDKPPLEETGIHDAYYACGRGGRWLIGGWFIGGGVRTLVYWRRWRLVYWRRCPDAGWLEAGLLEEACGGWFIEGWFIGGGVRTLVYWRRESRIQKKKTRTPTTLSSVGASGRRERRRERRQREEKKARVAVASSCCGSAFNEKFSDRNSATKMRRLHASRTYKLLLPIITRF